LNPIRRQRATDRFNGFDCRLLEEKAAHKGDFCFCGSHFVLKEVDQLITRKEKEQMVEAVTDDLKQASLIVITDYRGLNVDGISNLRNSLRAEQCLYRVTKNTLTRLACRRAGLEALEQYLTGPTAIAFTRADPVTAARILIRFSGENKTFSIKGGILEGQLLSPDKLKELGLIPPRAILYAKILGGFQAPIYNLVGTLNGTILKLVYAMEAVRRQKEKESA